MKAGRFGELGVSKNSGVFFPPNHPMFNRVFHDFHHPFWVFSPLIVGNTQIESYDIKV